MASKAQNDLFPAYHSPPAYRVLGSSDPDTSQAHSQPSASTPAVSQNVPLPDTHMALPLDLSPSVSRVLQVLSPSHLPDNSPLLLLESHSHLRTPHHYALIPLSFRVHLTV